MVEKSEFRIHGAQAVGMLTSQMKGNDYACFVKWLFRFSRSAKVLTPAAPCWPTVYLSWALLDCVISRFSLSVFQVQASLLPETGNFL